ncbi:CoA-dependent acyltransferase, partial [Caulochytrium protostelioides]
MPSTFEHEHALQRLPVPPLAQTVAVFLKSVQPLQSPEAHARTAALAAAFLANEGPELQRRLEAHDAAQPYSWLEAWWLRDAYLTWREGLMINSNWYMLLQDAARLPPLPIRREPQSAGYSRAQVHRATMVAVGLLKFHEQLCAGTVPPETTAAGQPLDMDQYRHLFGVCRVPKPGCDELVESFPSPSKHILLMAESQMAVIQVYTDVGQRVSVLHLYNQLCDALDMFAAAPTQQPPVSIFTGLHRDTWSSIYQEIIDASPAHADNMHAIQHALFAICLDANSQTLLQNYFATNTFHGPHGYNRWFDLGLSLVASTDGHVGINGEHSPCDALVPVLMVEQVMAAQPETDKDVVEQLPASAFPSPRPLLWNLPGPRFADHFAAADRAAAQAVLNSDVHVLRTNAIGSTFIKRQARCSPDAFVQMALQATFFRLHDELTPVYETASTRLFRHGRTETTRSLSNASAAFVRAL